MLYVSFNYVFGNLPSDENINFESFYYLVIKEGTYIFYKLLSHICKLFYLCFMSID